MIAANLFPFCRTEIFFGASVLPLKNASQLAVISALALPPAAAGAELLGAELLAGADEDAGAAADEEPAALIEGAPAADVELLLQAAAVVVRAKPSNGIAIR